jgi:hypothetical protein
MTAEQATRFRPNAAIFRDAAWRSGLVILATAGVLLGVPVWARAPLSVAAAAVTVLFFLRRSNRRGAIDTILVALGVAIVVVLLLGLALAALPVGINSASWGIGVGAAELVAIGVLAYWRAPLPARRTWYLRFRLAPVIWSVLIAGVLAAALTWSITSFANTHVPPLALSVSTSADAAVVTITSGSEQGPFDLRIVSASGDKLIAKNFRVEPGHPSAIRIDRPVTGSEKIQLTRAGESKTLRELILDSTTNTAKVTP